MPQNAIFQFKKRMKLLQGTCMSIELYFSLLVIKKKKLVL